TYLFLRYRCGGAAAVLGECPPEFAANEAEVEAQFQQMSKLVADSDTLPAVQRPDAAFFTFSTNWFGVEYRITSRNSPGSVLLAENLLGILEAALAVARWENLAFIQERFELRVDISTNGKNPAEIDFIKPPRNGEFRLECGSDLFDWLCQGPREEMLDWVRYFLFSVLF